MLWGTGERVMCQSEGKEYQGWHRGVSHCESAAQEEILQGHYRQKQQHFAFCHLHQPSPHFFTVYLVCPLSMKNKGRA